MWKLSNRYIMWKCIILLLHHIQYDIYSTKCIYTLCILFMINVKTFIRNIGWLIQYKGAISPVYEIPLWRRSYLHNRISYSGKTTSLYWIITMAVRLLSWKWMSQTVFQGSFCVCPQPMRERHIIMLSPIDWAHTQNDPYELLMYLHNT